MKFYTAEDITKAVNGEAAAGLNASTEKHHYQVSYVKNVLRHIEREPLAYGYSSDAKKIIRISSKKGAPKGYSMYYVDQAVDKLTGKVNPRRLLALKSAIENARITKKQIEKTMLKHGKYFPSKNFAQTFEFIEKGEKEPDIESQKKFIDSLYKQSYRRNQVLKEAWKAYKRSMTEVLTSKEISAKEKVDLLKSPNF